MLGGGAAEASSADIRIYVLHNSRSFPDWTAAVEISNFVPLAWRRGALHDSFDTGDNIRMPGCKIARFAGIVGKVVKFQRCSLAEANTLPVFKTDGLAEVSLEERMSDVFIQHFRSLNGEVKRELNASVQSAKQPLRLRSAFELPPKQQSMIQAALNETLAADVQIQFETEPDLISGIELSVNGKKMAWSVDDYLTNLETQ